MRALGVSEQLKAVGAKDGDTIMVGKVDFTYFDELPMAARARLAGYGDERPADPDDPSGEKEEDQAALEKRLDEELKELLDGYGDIVTY